MTRYLTGLGLAFLVVGVLSAGTLVFTSITAGRAPRLSTVLDVWIFFGTFTVIALAIIVGPVMLLLRRWLGLALTVGRARVVGAAMGPLLLVPMWFVTREDYETLDNLLAFWARLPMEFVIGVLPYAAAGALFAGWLAADKRTPRRTTA